jgi:KTSC domain
MKPKAPPENKIIHQPVKSSNIASIGHDPASDTLHVKFLNGGHYAYHGVDRTVYMRMHAAPSKGKFLHKWIKPKYRHTKIT